MMRIGQERLRGVAAMAGLANDTTDTPRCASQDKDVWRDRQTPWPAPDQQIQPQPLQVPPGKPDQQLCEHH